MSEKIIIIIYENRESVLANIHNERMRVRKDPQFTSLSTWVCCFMQIVCNVLVHSLLTCLSNEKRV